MKLLDAPSQAARARRPCHDELSRAPAGSNGVSAREFMHAGSDFSHTSSPARSVAHPIRSRLWKLAIVVGSVLLVIVVAEIVGRIRHPSHQIALGHDLLPSYAAGVLVREGHPRLMYDRNAVAAVERQTIADADLAMDAKFCPWLNPPFYAWAFAPLSALPYRQAAALFLAINVILLAASLVLLTRMVGPRQSRIPIHSDFGDSEFGFSPRGQILASTVLIPLLIVLPLPFWQAMCHQQNTFISLLLLSGAVVFWRRGDGFRAGVLAGLLFFKPQLAAVFAMALIVGMGWRALAGLAITGAALLAITLFTMPGCLGDFLHRLPPILHWLQNESPYNWGRQVTFQSFWRLLTQGQVRGETVFAAKLLWWASSAVVLAGLAVAARRHIRQGPSSLSRDRLIAAAVVSMPLLMPYYMDYDLLLLAIPAVLLASEWVRTPQFITHTDYWLLAAWIAVGLESYFNPALAGHTRLNLIVPLLATLSALHIARCLRRQLTPTTHRCPANI